MIFSVLVAQTSVILALLSSAQANAFETLRRDVQNAVWNYPDIYSSQDIVNDLQEELARNRQYGTAAGRHFGVFVWKARMWGTLCYFADPTCEDTVPSDACAARAGAIVERDVRVTEADRFRLDVMIFWMTADHIARLTRDLRDAQLRAHATSVDICILTYLGGVQLDWDYFTDCLLHYWGGMTHRFPVRAGALARDVKFAHRCPSGAVFFHSFVDLAGNAHYVITLPEF